MRRAVIRALARAGERSMAAFEQPQLQQLPRAAPGAAAVAAAAVAAARRGLAGETGGGTSSSNISSSSPDMQQQQPPSWLYDASLLPSSSSGAAAPAPPLRPPRLTPASSSQAGANSSSRPGRRSSGRSSSSSSSSQAKQQQQLPLLEALSALREARAAAVAAKARPPASSPSDDSSSNSSSNSCAETATTTTPPREKKKGTDETVEMHVRLRGVDPRRGDHAIRGAALLPHPVGRPPRVAVFAEPGTPAAEAARLAGADVVGGEALVDEIVESKGKCLAGIDRAVAHTDMAKTVARAGRVLGPRGLMPSPKVGTLTSDVGRAVRELRRGRAEFRADRAAALHLSLGKMSAGDEALAANAGALVAAVLAAKPEAVKAGLTRLLAKADLATTFGRGSVGVDVASLLRAADGAAAAMRRQQLEEEAEEEG